MPLTNSTRLRSRIRFLLGAFAALCGSSFVSAASDPAPASPRPILVELFTSEGCSSCPPADDLLRDLANTQPVAGALVVPLGEHVDYWNRLGWTDPFSSAEFSARQGRYVDVLGAIGTYTPQMVVDGRAEFLGSKRDAAIEAIGAAAREPKGELKVEVGTAGADARSIEIRFEASGLPTTVKPGGIEWFVVFTESGLERKIGGGENGGRTLRHAAVVRSFEPVRAERSGEGAPFTGKAAIRIDASWKRDALRAVVFAQEKKSRRVLAVGTAAVGK